MGVGENKRVLFMGWVGPQKSCLSWKKGIRNPLESDQVCLDFHSLQKQLIVLQWSRIRVSREGFPLPPLPFMEGILKLIGLGR